MNRKTKICKQCGSAFLPFNSITPVCSPKCALDFNSKKEADKRVEQMKKETRSLSDLRLTARIHFQAWIRERDRLKPCISCLKTEAKWDAGHYLKAEIYTGLIFDENNVHKQCSYCNCQLEGNIVEYRKGLIVRIGLQAFEELEAKADLSRVYKFSRQELIDIAVEYREKLKQLKSNNNAGYPVAEININPNK